MKVDTVLEVKGNQVVTMPVDTTVGDAVKLLTEFGIGAVLVCDGQDNLCGVLAERDVVLGLSKYGGEVLDRPISDVMRRNVSCCHPGTHLNDIMELMTDRRVRHVPVRDSDGHLCGIVSIGDIVKARMDEIESEAQGLREYIAMA